MHKRNVFRRFVIILAFVILPMTAYLTVSNPTTCQAQTCSCGSGTCVQGNGLIAVFTANLSNTIQPALADAAFQMRLRFLPLVVYFAYGIHPVIDWTVWKITRWFDIFLHYSMRPAMQAMTKELDTANVEQTVALASFADGAAANHWRWSIEDQSIKDHREQRPSGNVCTVASIVGGMTRANEFSSAYNSVAAAGRLWRSANGMSSRDERLEEQCSSDPPPEGVDCSAVRKVGPAADVNNRYGIYADRFCNPESNNGHAMCRPNRSSEDFIDKDVDVAGMIFSRDTIPLSSDEDDRTLDNLNQLIVNMAEPFVKDTITRAVATQEDLLAAQAYKTKRQIAYDSLYYVVSRRVPSGLTRDGEAAGNAQALLDALEGVRGLTHENTVTVDNPSRYEMLRALMTQQFRSGRYSLSQIDEPENNQRELVIDQALQLMQMSDQLDLMDHYSLLLAAQVSSGISGRGMLGTGSPNVPLRRQEAP